MTEPTMKRKSGPAPNTSLWLDGDDKKWLRQTFGGIQPGIRELIDAARCNMRPRLERLRRRQPRRTQSLQDAEENEEREILKAEKE